MKGEDMHSLASFFWFIFIAGFILWFWRGSMLGVAGMFPYAMIKALTDWDEKLGEKNEDDST